MISATEFYILVALMMHRARHGYEILLDVRSTAHMRMGPATLYTTLKRLLDKGMIAEVETPEGVDPRRRYYRITPAGRAALTEEQRRMTEALKLVLRKPRSARA